MAASVVRSLSVGMLLTCPLLLCAQETEAPPKVIAADEAVAHATKTVTVEFTVLNSNQIKDRNGRDVVFLNSMKDYRDEANFTVVIFSEALDKFRSEEIEEPAKYYRDKKVRVTGGIELRRGKAQINLKDPEKIEVVDEKASSAPPASPRR